MNINNVELVQNAINGDKKALSELIKREQNNIYSTLYYLKRNDDEINDLVQNVLIKLNTKIYQLKNPSYFKTWLNQIIINTYYDYLRKNKKPLNVVLTDDRAKLETVDLKTNPQDEVLYSELDKIIKKSITELPIQYKIPITLREIQGMSYADISNITNTSIGTVKSRISRARTILQDSIRKYNKG